MRLLLDTQIFIWFAVESDSLKPDTRKLIIDPANEPYLSHISLFEIAIKQKIGKLPTLGVPVLQLIALATAHRFSMLPISATHIAAYDRISLMPDHRDRLAASCSPPLLQKAYLSSPPTSIFHNMRHLFL